MPIYFIFHFLITLAIVNFQMYCLSLTACAIQLKNTVLFKSGVHSGETQIQKRPFTKIGDLKTDSSQKLVTKSDPSQKSETLKTDPKFKNYNVIFHNYCARNKFTRK